MGKQTDAWERQTWESDAAWDAFRRFLDKGAQRSHKSVSDELQISVKQVERWSEGNHWPMRVRAWNRSQDRAVKQRHREALRALAEQHRGVAQTLIDVGMQGLQLIDPAMLRPSESVAMLRLGTELQRNSFSYAAEDLEQVDMLARAVSEQIGLPAHDDATANDEADEHVASFGDMLDA